MTRRAGLLLATVLVAALPVLPAPTGVEPRHIRTTGRDQSRFDLEIVAGPQLRFLVRFGDDSRHR